MRLTNVMLRALAGAALVTGLVACGGGAEPTAVEPAPAGDDNKAEEGGEKPAEAAADKAAEGEAKPGAAAAAPATSSLIPTKGAADPLVRIYEVSEFQCPFCSRVTPTVKKIHEEYADTVAVSFLHNPLGFHKNAMPAAKASMAAHKQGKFWEFHDLAFANQKELTQPNFEKWAGELGLNLDQFKKDMADAALEKEILRQQKAAVALGARGTPGFLINGELLSGAQPFEKFKEVIDRQLEATKKIADGGKAKAAAIREVAAKQQNGANFVKWILDGEEPPANAAPAQKNAQRKPRPVPKTVWKVTLDDMDYHHGPKDALVKIVTFSEFQCPYCKRIKPTLDKIRETYGDDVALIFKHNPLPFHKDAPMASEAALAAGEQGKFWEFHDKLFENQKALQRANLEGYATELGLDVDKFKKALDSGKHKGKVAADMKLAADVKAKGTPNNFINGRQLTGAQPFEAFKTVIDEELAKAKKMVEGGTARADVYNKIVANGKVFKALDDTAHDFDIEGSPIVGKKDAKVKIFEFSDFQCPYCGRLAPVVKQVQKQFPNDVALVFKHFPLSFHKDAKPASIASLAAMRQGKFWEFHDKAFANMKALTAENFKAWATELGLDMAKFEKDLADPALAAKVDKDMAEGRKAGVRGTPSLYLNGRKFEPAGMTPEAIAKTIKEEFLDKK